MPSVRIGIVDSGWSHPGTTPAPPVADSASFHLDGKAIRIAAATPDRLGHGSRIAAVIQAQAPAADLLIAQVFIDRLTTTAAQVAAAIDWLVAARATIINLSLGLREPRSVLGAACERAGRAGVILCAAAPARGAAVYPAAYPEVLAVTGDARCTRHEFAALGAAHADFGAHVRPLDGSLDGAGASMACAHFSGLLARRLIEGPDLQGGGNPDPGRQGLGYRHWPRRALVGWLAAAASYHGLERRRGEP